MAVANKLFSEDMAKEIQSIYDVSKGEAISSFTPKQKKDLLADVKNNLLRKKDLIRKTALKKQKLEGLFKKFGKYNKNNKLDPKEADRIIKAILTKDRGKGAGFSNIEYRTHAILDLLKKDFVGPMADLRAKIFSQDRDLADDLVRAMYDPNNKNINPKAKDYADKWEVMSDKLVKMFNDAGGDIKELASWRLPQSHNPSKILKVGKDAYIEKLRNSNISINGFKKSEIDDELLGIIYETITTGGLNKLDTATIKNPKAKKMLANTMLDHRVIHFLDSEGWLKYNSEFGNPDIFGGMMDHVQSMAQKISMMEILGPNPEAMFEHLKLFAKKESQQDIKFNGADRMYNVVSGYADGVESTAGFRGQNLATALSGGARSINTASKLGSAALSATTDVSTVFATAKYNNMSFTKVMKRALELMPDEEKQKWAISKGVVADSWMGEMGGSRYAEAAGIGWAQNMASKVIRMSGMQLWTDSFRRAFQLEFLGNLENIRKIPFNNLNDKFKVQLKNYGITEAEFKSLNHSDSPDGILDLEQIKDSEVQKKILEFARTETDYAVL